MRKSIFLFLGVLLLLGAYSPAPSQANLVQNGGFESGDFTWWTQGGNLGFTTVASGSGVPHSGTYAAQLGPIGSDGFFSQVLATTPGQFYTVSFWLRNANTGTPNDFHLSWAGNPIFSLVNSPSFAYTQYSFVEQAINPFTILTVGGFRNDPAWFHFDDVDVSPVPIPGTLMLLGSGLVGLVGYGRMRLKK